MTDAIYRYHNGAYNRVGILGTTLYFSYTRLMGVVKEGRAYINRGPSIVSSHVSRMENESTFPDADHRYSSFGSAEDFMAQAIKVLSTSKRMVQAERYLQDYTDGLALPTGDIDKFLKKEDHDTQTQS